MLWDMGNQVVASTLPHPDKVQSLQFHPFEIQTLLTGCCDELVRVYDCRSESFKNWKVEGEVERVLWDHFNPYCFLASTESGHVYYMDARNDEKPLWQLNAHTKACTGLSLSSQCPGCLVTASQDKMFKIWDIQSGKPTFVCEHEFKIGGIYVANACPDAPFAFCMGGDNRSDNFKVWDIRQSSAGTFFFLSSNFTGYLDFDVKILFIFFFSIGQIRKEAVGSAVNPNHTGTGNQPIVMCFYEILVLIHSLTNRLDGNWNKYNFADGVLTPACLFLQTGREFSASGDF